MDKHTVEHYAVVKRNKVLKHATTWSSKPCWEKEARQKSHTVWSHLYEISRIDKAIETKHRLMVDRGWGEGGEGENAQWVASFTSEWWKCLTRQRWQWHNIMNVLAVTELFALKNG